MLLFILFVNFNSNLSNSSFLQIYNWKCSIWLYALMPSKRLKYDYQNLLYNLLVKSLSCKIHLRWLSTTCLLVNFLEKACSQIPHLISIMSQFHLNFALQMSHLIVWFLLWVLLETLSKRFFPSWTENTHLIKLVFYEELWS